ncbi:MAG: Gmad2 immunoglobulin-like domain-containing protein [Micrococcaceae bacterium]|nr:Gmad2 immunoglobulin-like domain-containing protein [Micrococcaceae bacterium]
MLAAALVAALVWVGILLMQGSGDTGDGGQTTAPATSAPPSIPEPSTTSSSPAATESTSPMPSSAPATLPADEAAGVIWPDPAGTLRYENPEDAAAGFAEEFAGFTDPIYGEFMQGDSRSGELEVRAVADGPVTTVLLRQFTGDQWYIIAATTSEIDLESPEAREGISSPVALSGTARAFEGLVEVQIRAHGISAPLGQGQVIGGAGQNLEPFSQSLQWQNPGSGFGSLLLTVSTAKDGGVWAVEALPVGFAAQP